MVAERRISVRLASELFRIYCKLELNLRITPRKRLAREKPELLVAPEEIGAVWSIDFMHDQLEDGRNSRLFNATDDFIRTVRNE